MNAKNRRFQPIAILLMASVVVLSATSVRAFTDGDFEYSLDSSDEANLTATVTRYNGSASMVSIPSFVEVPEQYRDEDGEMHTRFKVFTVVSIGEWAFSGNTALTSVHFPSSVTSIQKGAFSDCTALTHLPLSNIVNFGGGAFRNCTSITSVTTSDKVSYYAYGVFQGCTSLVSAEINGNGSCTIQGGYNYGNGFFGGCSSLEVVKIGSGVTAITSQVRYGGDDSGAMFSGCDSLREVDFGGVGDLYHGSLRGRTSLKTCRFPAATSIGNNQFSGCSGLEEITPLDNITSIGEYAFDGCSGLSVAICLPNIESMGRYAFRNCTSITSVTTSDKIGYYPYGVFQGCTSLVSAEINGNGNCTIQGGYDYGNGFFKDCSSIEVITLGSGVTAITSQVRYGGDDSGAMFSGCDSLREVDFGGVGDLYHGSLRGRTSLKTCRFPAATSIGNNQFSGCSGLEEISALDNIVSIGASAFSGCTGLTGALNLARVRSIGQSAFTGCTGFSGTLNLPQATSIGNAAFENCSSLAEVSTTENMVSYGAGIFAGCTSLVSVVINGDGGCVLYGGKADYRGFFQDCLSLQTCKLGSGISGITSSGYYGVTRVYDMFRGCSSLREVDFGGVADLQHASLANHPSLEKCYFPSASTIPANMFSGCVGLHEMTSMDNILNIGGSAFSGCSNLVMELSLPAVKNIDSRAFSDCRGLTGVVELAAIVSMGDRVFQNCSGIRAVNFGEDLSKLSEWGFTGSTNLVAFSFEGVQPPDNVNNNAFGGVARGAFGVYPMSRLDYDTAGVKLSKVRLMASESTYPSWEDQIAENGMWKGLIMAANKPILTNDQYHVSEGSLRLNWDNEKAKMPPRSCGVTYEVRRGFTDSYESAEVLTNGYEELTFTDKQFDFTGGVSRIWYWVKPEHQYVEFEQSDSCRTKNRYGLYVGYDDYAPRNVGTSRVRPNGHRQALADARLFRNLSIERANFNTVQILENIDAKTQDIRDSFINWANVITPGDMLVFFIATHGAYNGNDAALTTYDGKYHVSQLVYDSELLPSDAKFLGVVMACHSRAMVDYTDSNPEMFQYQIRNGLAKCRANATWISSCNYNESSWNSTTSVDHSGFGEWFLEEGWQNGFADVALHGMNYAGGNEDGILTMLELVKYTRAFYNGWSDAKPSEVFWDEEHENLTGLLGRFIIDLECYPSTLSPPIVPTGVETVTGDSRIEICWSAVPNVKGYRIYRNSSWIGNTGARRFYDHEAMLTQLYGYRVKAFNSIGISDFSDFAFGRRGTSAYIDYLASHSNVMLNSADAYDAFEKSGAANGTRTIGECYALGIDPEDPNDDLKITDFKIEDGKPVITLNHTKDGSGNSFEPRIKTLGKANLTEADWVDVTDKDQSAYRFFKVTVDMP